MQVDVKFIYSYQRFGLVLEAGNLFTNESSVHIFMGPMINIINTEKLRVPLTIGFDLFHGNTLFYGVGGTASIHYILTKRLYLGLNAGFSYVFNNVYNEITGYNTIREVVDDGMGNPVFADRNVPIIERKNHFGNYFYFRPSILIGIKI